MTYKTYFAILLILCCTITANAQDSAEQTPESVLSEEVQKVVFRKIRTLVDDGSQLVSLYKKLAEAPESTSIWQPRTADKSEIQSRINRLAGKVEEILLPSEFTDFTREYRDKKDRIQAIKSEIIELKISRFSAPESQTYFQSIFTDSKESIDTSIAEREEKIKTLEADIESLIASYSEHIYSAYGIRLMPEQLVVLLSRIDGEDIARATAIVGATGDVLRGLEMQLNSIESIDTARKYYAITVLAREALVHLWNDHHAQYDEDWIPQIDELDSELHTLIEANRAALRSESSEDRKSVLRKNIEANEFSLRVLHDYKLALVQQRDRVSEILSEARADLDVARLTLETVSASSDLLSIIKQSQDDYRALMEVQLPDIRAFQNEELRNEYDRITQKLNQ